QREKLSRKLKILENSTFYVLPDLIDLLMIPRKIGRLPDQRGFNIVRGYLNMAMNKTAGETKKAAAKGGSAKKAAPKKRAVAKKAAGPKLTDPQREMLKKVASHADPAGYHPEKKENKVLEALLKHKLVKRGKKHPTTGHYHVSVSKAGTKYLGSSAAPKS